MISIELTDSAENIFDRLIFSDENDVSYKDDAYKNLHRNHYLEETQADLDWHGLIYSDIKNKYNISGMPPAEAVAKMIDQFQALQYIIRNTKKPGI